MGALQYPARQALPSFRRTREHSERLTRRVLQQIIPGIDGVLVWSIFRDDPTRVICLFEKADRRFSRPGLRQVQLLRHKPGMLASQHDVTPIHHDLTSRHLGSHMLDMTLFLFGPHQSPGEMWSVNRFENQAPDHVLFGYRGQPALEMEATLLSWRNTFGLDVYGELGSAHINCLCKWGPSTLTVRKRVLPSGRPAETVEMLEQPDPTWKLEYEHFLALCRTGGTNLENDLWIQSRISHLAAAVRKC